MFEAMNEGQDIGGDTGGAGEDSRLVLKSKEGAAVMGFKYWRNHGLALVRYQTKAMWGVNRITTIAP